MGSMTPPEPTRIVDVAAATGTINYELVTRIGPRLPRLYRGDI